QFRLHRPRIPDPGRNEVVQLIVFAKPKPLRHRLNALTSARTDQPRHVEWTHLSPRLVTQPIQKRLEKASKLFFPIRRPSNHGRPLQSRPPMSHRKTDLGIPCRSKSAKVVLVVVGWWRTIVSPRRNVVSRGRSIVGRWTISCAFRFRRGTEAPARQ